MPLFSWFVFVDADMDGYDAQEDCNDGNAAIHPGAIEIPGDEVDGNCDDAELCYADADNDLARSVATVASADTLCNAIGEATSGAPLDCDDADNTAFPGATEIVGNGNDNDCNGGELCFLDADADAYRDPIATAVSNDEDCDDPLEAYDVDPVDCDDADPLVSPGAIDVCGNGKDDDCDGLGDFYGPSFLDDDDDGLTYQEELLLGFSDCDTDSDDDGITDDVEAAAPVDYDSDGSPSDEDCDDANPTRYPGATEICEDGVDQDCDGADEDCGTPPTDTGTPPTSDTITEPDPTTPTTGDSAAGGDKPDAGCGCGSGAPASLGWLALALVPLARRVRPRS
jgi:uncharacterized protein (TIGR03382 family)